METKQRYFLKADDKLKSRKAIEVLFKEGKSFSNFPFRICWQNKIAEQSELKAGFAVSTKNFKKATDRNLIKRLMREAYRLQKNTLQEKVVFKNCSVHIFFIYTGTELPKYELVFLKIDAILKRLIKLINTLPNENDK